MPPINTFHETQVQPDLICGPYELLVSVDGEL